MIPRRAIDLPTLPGKAIQKKLVKALDVYHPGYPNLGPMLSLHCTDGNGVHYTIVYTACCIIAGNVWADSEGRESLRAQGDAYLSTTIEEAVPVKLPTSDILGPGQYYFHVPGWDDLRYPIFANFAEWIYPVDKPLPRRWRKFTLFGNENKEDDKDAEDQTGPNDYTAGTESVVNDNVLSLVEPCRLSGEPNGVELGHVVPTLDKVWFEKNRMYQYAQGTEKPKKVFDSFRNRLPLSSEIHRFFDNSSLTFVPKPDHASTPDPGTFDDTSYALVTHVLRGFSPSSGANVRMVTKYHNLYPRNMTHIPTEYLFARFAWSIFNNAIYTLFNFGDVNGTEFRLLFTKSILPTQRGKSQPEHEIRDVSDGNFEKPRNETRRDRGTKRSREEADDDRLSIDSFDPGEYERNFEDLYYDSAVDNEYSSCSYSTSNSSTSSLTNDDEHANKRSRSTASVPDNTDTVVPALAMSVPSFDRVESQVRVDDVLQLSHSAPNRQALRNADAEVDNSQEQIAEANGLKLQGKGPYSKGIGHLLNKDPSNTKTRAALGTNDGSDKGQDHNAIEKGRVIKKWQSNMSL